MAAKNPSTPIPLGLCQCGCGTPTNLITRKSSARGTIVGQPYRFWGRHRARRADVVKYRAIHHNGRPLGLHRIRAERALGHPLPSSAVVHHADGSKHEDAPRVICQDEAYHHLLHLRMRVKAAGGNPNTDALCSRCRLPRPLGEFHRKPTNRYGRTDMCKPCRNTYRRAVYAVQHPPSERTRKRRP